MKALIQQRNGRFTNIAYYTAWLGFQELGFETVLVEESDFAASDTDPHALVAGELTLVQAALERRGVQHKPIPYIPDALLPFAGRRVVLATVDGLRRAVESGNAVFAKPPEDSPRYFKGQVFRNYRDLIRTAGLEPSTVLWCSDLVDFVSEYRVYVCRGSIVGLKHYAGDFRVFPDCQIIDRALQAYAGQPAGFGLDFGVTADGRTLVVEQNDGFSLGTYGLHPVAYARLLEARWNELTRADR